MSGPAPDGSCRLGPWDLRHLLLSIDDRARPRRERDDLVAVMARAAAELAAVVPAPVTVPGDWAGPGGLLAAVPLWLFATNAWVLAPSGRGGYCIVVDVPPDPGALVARLAADDLEVAAVFITHGHLDHCGGVAELLAAHPGRYPVYVHPADRAEVLRPGPSSGLLGRLARPDDPDPSRVLDTPEGLHGGIAGVQVQAVHTPGHTAGSTCLLVKGAGRDLLFSGDHLCARGIGRTDLPGGSDAGVMASMAVVAQLADGTAVLPGHGDATTVGRARVDNPFLAQAGAPTSSGSGAADSPRLGRMMSSMMP